MRSILAAVVVIAWVVPAVAQPPDPDKLFIEGRELLKQNKGKEACDKFHEVNSINPDAPSVLLNLGLCYEMQNKLATAIEWFLKAQDKASKAQPQTDDMKQFEDAAKEGKARLEPKVARIRIDFKKTQADVEVRIDGEKVDRNNFDPIQVDAGKRKIEAGMPGMKTWVVEITISPENKPEQEVIEIPLLVKAPVIPVGSPPKGTRGRGILFAIVGTVLAVGIPFGANEIQKRNADTDHPGDYKFGEHLALGSMGVVWVASLAAVGYGGYLIFKKQPGEEERRMAIRPLLGPGNVGVVLGGRF